MRVTVLFVAVLCCLGWTTGCNVINPKEKVPNYVHIDSFTFNAPSYSSLGTASHKITNVWVYFNNNPVGVFDLPVTFPVIVDQPGTLTVLPGIDLNGMKGQEVVYPFYSPDSIHLTPNPGVVETFAAKTGYSATAKMLWTEDFELGNSFSKFNGDTTLMRTGDPDKVFEKKWSGYVYLDTAYELSENISSNSSTFLPVIGNTVYLEFDYKSTAPIQIGLETDFTNADPYYEYIGGFNPHPSGWNKAYVDVTDFVNAHEGYRYRVVVGTGLPDGTQNQGWILIDNIKIISYK